MNVYLKEQRIDLKIIQHENKCLQYKRKCVTDTHWLKMGRDINVT
jgi:hypothetical protein